MSVYSRDTFYIVFSAPTDYKDRKRSSENQTEGKGKNTHNSKNNGGCKI